MKIVIASDAWSPQVNGVVRTLETMAARLAAAGHAVRVLQPGLFRTLPCPSYPSIRLAVLPGRGVCRMLDGFQPDALHIATEGPIGQAARRWALDRSMPFTTSFHTQFPEYIRARVPLPLDWSYAWLRRFHAAAVRTMVPTPSQAARLAERGFDNLVLWSRGVDTSVFRPGDRQFLRCERPLLMYMGRVAVEKNIEAFLELDVHGTRYVVGDGPDLERLRRSYPEVVFTGAKHGAELAACLGAADVFVFPSRTDTFGLVLIEAMACGVPVAAYPVTGPIDVVRHGETGVLDDDLAAAVRGALRLDRGACVAAAQAYSWSASARQFEAHLAPRQSVAMRPPVAQSVLAS